MGTPSNDLNISQAGYVNFDGVATFTGRTFQAGTGITLTNASGVSGNTTIGVSGSVVGQTITGNSGGAINPTAGNWNIVTSNSTVTFAGSVSTLTQNFQLTNLLLGSSGSSISSGTQSVGLGHSALNALTSGIGNTCIGYVSGLLLSTGDSNTILGANAFVTSVGASNNTGLGKSSLNKVSTGLNNTAVGISSLSALDTGSYNTVIGSTAGVNYTGSESSNLLLRNNGTAAESNTIRIGTAGSGSGQQNRAFIAGVTGVTVSASAPVAVDTNGQLSSLGFGTSGQLLQSGGAGVSPAYTTATYPATAGTAGNVLTSDGTNFTSSAPLASFTQFSTNIGNPADGVTYYLANIFGLTSFTAIAGSAKLWIPRNATITKVYGSFTVAGTLGSNENTTVALRLNDTSNTNISTTVQLTASTVNFSNTGLSISLSAGDYITPLLICPTWGTNPTSVAVTLSILFAY